MAETKFQFLIDLKVGQPHPHGGQAVLPRVDGRINLRLRPVLRALLTGDELGRQSRGFDLINGRHAVSIGKNTVGAALQRVGDLGTDVVLLQRRLSLIVRVLFYGGTLQFAVQACALQRAVKAGKTAVNAAGAQ